MSDDQPAPPPNPRDWLTIEEKAAAERARLYLVHKARGTLGTYYYLYPDERPVSRFPPASQGREDEGRERER